MSEQVQPQLPESRRGIELGLLLAKADLSLYEYGPEDTVPTEHREQIQNDLDELWPSEYTECLFSGWATKTDGTCEQTDYIEAGYGFCDGFWITRFGKTTKGSWQVGLGFNQYSDDDTLTHDVHYILSLQASHGVVPIIEVENALPAIPTVHDILSKNSDSLSDQLSAPGFLSLNCQEQKQVVARAIRTTHEKCAEFCHDISAVPLVVEAELGYALVYNGKTAEYRPFELHALTLTGSCRDIGSLVMNQLNRWQAIQSTEQLIDPKAGLCLLFEPDDKSLQSINDFNDIPLSPDSTIVIPISSQDIEVIFASDISRAVQSTEYGPNT
jgi:hypothetical protein